ncbi:hypothetical protein Lepto7376_0852 [[Leptolyngbya] sp. PCC 7376]|uniref:hypothetical protein n=1 Tax=[Leptolyngbya] sp. PCC 7376 TaxID=111781 RepID=UPI00029ECB5E|nr:hypothetical protein [[Leptolyngbya] sp. PCC 7376]AFY37247.1 hypothetical protein Lepto7376_0852 [[Leptolyngbya] sp. PCC 7376]
MSPRKLTNADKEELLVAYRDTAATTSTLAEQYGVSSSTISRFLKSRLSTEEYEDLIQKKRLGRSNSLKKAKAKKSDSKSKSKSASKDKAPKLKPKQDKAKPEIEITEIVESVKEASDSASSDEQQEKPKKRRTRSRRSRSKTEEKPLPLLQELDSKAQQDDSPDVKQSEEVVVQDEQPQDMDESDVNQDLLALAQEIRLGDRQQALKELLGDDIDDLEEEDDDDEYDDDEQDDTDIGSSQRILPDQVQILPLNQASFPRTCYVVTDRMSELIARPLKEFRELGQIPDEETSQKTLPIFDNHRVAKRFTHGRSQKVIKVPDSRLFLKTSACLTAKGITRVLLDGQVYALSLETIDSKN